MNGNERLIRLLVVPRRNHVVAISRPTYRNRGPGFTQYATVIRCARPDQSSQTVALHLLEGGDAKLRLTVSKQEFFVPLVLLLRALRPTSDAELFHRGCGGDTSDSFVCDRLQLMLLEAARLPEALHTPDQCLSFLGARFRPILRPPARLTDAEVGRLLLRRHVLVHLAAEAVDAKWELLLLMLQKLYALAAERCAEDSPDSLVNQEMLLPGHLWLMILQEKLRAFLAAVRDAVVKKIEGAADDADFRDARWFRGCLDKGLGKMKDVGQKLTYFLATGNLVSETGLDLQQSAGYTIVAERLNYWRYLAHFRSIHRGAFFAQLRTTHPSASCSRTRGVSSAPCTRLTGRRAASSITSPLLATSRFSRLPATRSRTSSVLRPPRRALCFSRSAPRCRRQHTSRSSSMAS